MTDRAMSEAAMLESLRDIRLPEVAAGGLLADLLVAAGLAGLAVLVVAGLFRLISLRRPPKATSTLTDALQEAESLPEPLQRTAFLHMLRQHAPERYKALRGALYASDELTTPMIREEVARLV